MGFTNILDFSLTICVIWGLFGATLRDAIDKTYWSRSLIAVIIHALYYCYSHGNATLIHKKYSCRAVSFIKKWQVHAWSIDVLDNKWIYEMNDMIIHKQNQCLGETFQVTYLAVTQEIDADLGNRRWLVLSSLIAKSRPYRWKPFSCRLPLWN